jgi:hypothetical protein
MTSRSRNGMNKLSIVDLRADRCALTSPDAPVPWELRILSLFEFVRGVILAKCCPRVDPGRPLHRSGCCRKPYPCAKPTGSFLLNSIPARFAPAGFSVAMKYRVSRASRIGSG